MLELLGAQRQSKDNFGVANLGLDVIVGAAVDKFERGKLLPQAVEKPGRNLPEFEAVLNDQEDFHRAGLSTRVKILNPGGHTGT
jgi:hypothetical protein